MKRQVSDQAFVGGVLFFARSVPIEFVQLEEAEKVMHEHASTDKVKQVDLGGAESVYEVFGVAGREFVSQMVDGIWRVYGQVVEYQEEKVEYERLELVEALEEYGLG